MTDQPLDRVSPWRALLDPKLPDVQTLLADDATGLLTDFQLEDPAALVEACFLSAALKRCRKAPDGLQAAVEDLLRGVPRERLERAFVEEVHPVAWLQRFETLRAAWATDPGPEFSDELVEEALALLRLADQCQLALLGRRLVLPVPAGDLVLTPLEEEVESQVVGPILQDPLPLLDAARLAAALLEISRDHYGPDFVEQALGATRLPLATVVDLAIKPLKIVHPAVQAARDRARQGVQKIQQARRPTAPSGWTRVFPVEVERAAAALAHAGEGVGYTFHWEAPDGSGFAQLKLPGQVVKGENPRLLLRFTWAKSPGPQVTVASLPGISLFSTKGSAGVLWNVLKAWLEREAPGGKELGLRVCCPDQVEQLWPLRSAPPPASGE